MSALREEFIRFAVDCGVLRFGEFVTKAGRTSPYFFNAGLFNDGQSLGKLADYYAETLLQSGTGFDMLFGPAYKGIPLVAAVAISLARKGRNVPFAYNRKEAKDHGEGGVIVGAPLKGRVVIVDDVISAGTSVNGSVGIIRKSGATPGAVLIALDRMERSGKDDALSAFSAVQEVQRTYDMPVISISNLDDLLGYLEKARASEEMVQYGKAVKAYRDKYGAIN
ncbi:orotate phosphoribosyltransferase [Oxalobacter paraformigenes]|uniref:Orotate phosphoribosyltransferase n=1 Tax=Oxalobacter paraformigenes TaxID=556268 RepID=C3X5L0_9BURK|nr:orotate phosphoribosyltransferase [Oxalobacter paraformigenes]EEO28496.1 orotate phosphoribosyltransferase [Oxalobacter paraformigenes]